MTGVLNANTVVRNPETGTVVVLRAGTKVPKWAAERVGDHLLGGTPETPGPKSKVKVEVHVDADQLNAGLSNVEDAVETLGNELDKKAAAAADVLPEPPRAGRGSGIEAWKAYAASLGIGVPDDAQRDDVIDLVVAKRDA